ncbi:MAG: hypothetical protein HY720_25860, partial [Planctomycetes bacterium]|nr:hypothetical protein [Planctomycetota bacterium]
RNGEGRNGEGRNGDGRNGEGRNVDCGPGSPLDRLAGKAGGREAARSIVAAIHERLVRRDSIQSDPAADAARKTLEAVEMRARAELSSLGPGEEESRKNSLPALRDAWEEARKAGRRPLDDPAVRDAIRRANLPLLDAVERLRELARDQAAELADRLAACEIERIRRALARLLAEAANERSRLHALEPLADLAGKLAPPDFREIASILGVSPPANLPGGKPAGGPGPTPIALADRLQYQLAAHLRLVLPSAGQGPTRHSERPARIWGIGHPPSEIRISWAIRRSGPILVPDRTLLRAHLRPTPAAGTRPGPEGPPDLEIWIDSSGSMANPTRTLALHVVAAVIAALSALEAGASVKVINFSGSDETRGSGFLVQEFTRDLDPVLAALLAYHGGGTVLPLETLRHTSRSPRPRKVYYLAITDTYVANPPDQVLAMLREVFEVGLLAGRRTAGWTLFLAGSRTPLVDRLQSELGDPDRQRVIPATPSQIADRTLALAAEVYT